MGRPFQKEIELLENTIEFAETVEIRELERYILENIHHPFLVVGSGGSLSVAMACENVIHHIGGAAQTVTPYELASYAQTMWQYNVILFTAGGGNPDIINAYSFCKKTESNSIFILCLSRSSKLVELAKKNYHEENYLEISLPSGKDGFLAVNSTVCAMVLLNRINDKNTRQFFSTLELSEQVNSCINADSLIVLGGHWTMPVVYDFESKCTEAGLIQVMPSDYRNFAHGRHHWIAKNPNTAVLCFATKDQATLAEKTCSILPKGVCSNVFVSEKHGMNATIELLLNSFLVVQELGKKRGIDPGKPGVPSYGSRIYHINYSLFSEAVKKGEFREDIVGRMVQRKMREVPISRAVSLEETAKQTAKTFLDRMKAQYFSSIVLDYDNTIIRNNNIFDETFKECLDMLVEFSCHEIGICFATGRGKSIREQLLKSIPVDKRDRFFVAYYNGAVILPLNSELPPNNDCPDPALLRSIEYIKSKENNNAVNADIRNSLLSFCDNTEEVFELLSHAVRTGKLSGVKVFKSDHSVDVLPLTISKRNAVEYMRQTFGGTVLCIGDSGNEEGNDYELLDCEYSLSVDKVSVSFDNCWNIATVGTVGPDATKEYLNKLITKEKGIKFSSAYLKYIDI